MLASMANQGASSSSAPFTKSWKYHVFLSFRGFDTRSNFTSHLYSALRLQGINTFMDDDELRRGEEISSALLAAIEDSRISVVAFSENYASSKWCLDELVKILDCKESNQQSVIPVFYKVDPSDVRNHGGSFGDALANMDCNNVEKVDRWKEALSQAGKLAGFTLSDEHRSEAELIHKIVQDISQRVIDRSYLHVTEYPVGMHHPVEVITKLLALREEEDVRMVGVWGTGGIGKTTIAKAVYNSIAHEFEACSFLANVRERSTSHEGSVELRENLLLEILRGKKLKVTNVDKGVTMIKECLIRKKVLLVLDDVDDMEQLHKLVGACEWFDEGSRIIITTRDKQLLIAHRVNSIYEVKILDDDKALEPFKTSEPPLGDYVELAERAIRYAQGLPLALKVLGSHLCGGGIVKWKAALKGFKNPKIHDVLKLSYNALDHSVQQVFLDIACFFKGESRNYVTEACELNTRYGIDVLIEKALISIVHGYSGSNVEHDGEYIQMHDLLEKMGKDIIEQESPTELGKRSRLWFHENVEHVLTNNTGTNKITGIVLNFPEQDDEIFLDVGTSFSKMKNLKILINYNICLSGDANSIPNNLSVLDWHGCPFQSFPANFRPKALFVLNLPHSRIIQLGEGLKLLTKLHFPFSYSLIEIPDLSSCPNLRYLEASGCTSLVEVHPSVGNLDKLVLLDFSYCRELTKFPNKVRLKSLNFFGLKGCKKLESFPEIVDKMKSLNELDLWGTAIKELPVSIGHLVGLKNLELFGSAIKELPSSIGNLIGLKRLNLSKSAIKELPSSIGNLTTLKVLTLDGSAIEELPSSIENLTALELLNLEGCDNLANLPQSIYGFKNLRDINLSRCPKLVTLPNNLISEVLSSAESLPLEVRTKSYSSFKSYWVSLCFEECNVSNIDSLENFCCWSNLIHIDLSKSNFVSLPVCISKCVNLKYLYLTGCKRLVEILVQLPASIEKIDMGDCISLERFSTLSKILEDEDMQGIIEMDLSNCHRLCDNLGLDVSKMAKLLNKMKGREWISVKLPGNGSEVPEWFTFRNYFDDYDESKFDYYDCDGRSVRNFELPIEIPWNSVLENTKLFLCAVWEITESFVSPCSLKFELDDYLRGRDKVDVSGGEIGAGNVWLECIPYKQLKTPIFQVEVSGKGLRIKSIGAHLAPISMSRDGDDDGKHMTSLCISMFNENELDDD